MKLYYISRGVIAILMGGFSYLFSGSLPASLLIAAAIFAIFLYLPRTGRYSVFPDKGTTALRRDEWSQHINQRSGRNAWVIVTIAGSGLVLYFGLISPGDVPTGLLGGLLVMGAFVYYASDFWMRRL